MNSEINKLDMQSKDIVGTNIEKIGKIFPNVVKDGKIDFETLKQELMNDILDDKREKYQFTWVGKKKCILEGNSRSNKTLLPLKDKSVDFDETKNIYIEGDNLEVLKILQESYLNKIKCIYIDPPYNTGNDFIYNDDFNKERNVELTESGQIDEYNNRLISNTDSNGKYHSDWLSMIYPRLKLARNLLTKDGLIFISIDDNELYNLKKVCDEIFGEGSYLNTIVVESGGAFGAKTAHKDKTLFKVKDYILVYQKNSDVEINRVPLYDKASEPFDPRYSFYIKDGIKENLIDFFREDNYISNEFKKYNLEVKKENISKLMKINDEFNKYIINEISQYIYKDSQFTLKVPNEVVCNLNAGDMIEYDKYLLMKTSNGNIRHLQPFSDAVVMNDECEAEVSRSVLRGDLWKNFVKDMGNVGKEGGVEFKNGKKPIRLLKQLIKWSGINEGIILDFFSGSASTAHAIMSLNATENKNLKYIMVQIPERINDKDNQYGKEFNLLTDLGEERIRRSAQKIKNDTNADIDYGFRVYKVDSSNMKDVYYEPSKLGQTQLSMLESNIKEDRTPEDLLTQVILNLGLTIDLKIEEKEILNNKVFYVANNSLVACFDNQINIDIINEICEVKPLKVVFRENSFRNDSDKINCYERIKKLSPETEMNVI